jgi:hypothetical protein
MDKLDKVIAESRQNADAKGSTISATNELGREYEAWKPFANLKELLKKK